MSLGEILVKALTNTLLGMGTVFVVLIFIAFLISLLPRLTAAIESIGKKKSEPAPVTPKQVSSPVTAAVVEAEEEELADDLELVAIITAAIAVSEGMSTDGFVVRSFRKSPQNKWKRA